MVALKLFQKKKNIKNITMHTAEAESMYWAKCDYQARWRIQPTIKEIKQLLISMNVQLVHIPKEWNRQADS